MIPRSVRSELERLLDWNPAVVLMGPRQVGKTTLALELARERDCVYLDLERPSDLAKISDIEEFCALNDGKLLILDEVHRAPDLFAPLRGVIDQRRRAGRGSGQFLFLGSAGIDLLSQSSETLAGRVAYCELRTLGAPEVGPARLHQVWLRGGFPTSFLARDDARSLEWRLNFVETYLQRHIPQIGPRVPAETLRRFWTMLAHNQAQLYNASALARGLDVSGVTVSRYLDLMVDLLLVSRLQPWTSNLGKRLVRAPKTYIRDSGICHALLGIRSLNDLLGHPVVGSSWEAFVIENIAGALPRHASIGFYRTAGGAEIDLVIELGAGRLVAVEIKRGRAPRVSRGFRSACEDLKPFKRFVVHSGDEDFPLSGGVEAVTVEGILRRLANLG